MVSVHIQYYSHYFTFGCIDFAVTVIKENFTAKKAKKKMFFVFVYFPQFKDFIMAVMVVGSNTLYNMSWPLRY